MESIGTRLALGRRCGHTVGRDTGGRELPYVALFVAALILAALAGAKAVRSSRGLPTDPRDAAMSWVLGLGAVILFAGGLGAILVSGVVR